MWYRRTAGEVGAREGEVFGCGTGGLQEIAAREGKVFGCGKRGLQEVGRREGEVFARSVWSIHCSEPRWESRKKTGSYISLTVLVV